MVSVAEVPYRWVLLYLIEWRRAKPPGPQAEDSLSWLTKNNENENGRVDGSIRFGVDGTSGIR
jgi:hypothetical protein